MKSNTKAQKTALSMKDALNEFKSLKVVESHNEHKDWRNGWIHNILFRHSLHTHLQQLAPHLL